MADEAKNIVGGNVYSIQAVGGDRVIGRLDGMIKTLTETLPRALHDEFWTWQTVNMNRNKPHIDMEGRQRMVTHFWSRKRPPPGTRI